MGQIDSNFYKVTLKYYQPNCAHFQHLNERDRWWCHSKQQKLTDFLTKLLPNVHRCTLGISCDFLSDFLTTGSYVDGRLRKSSTESDQQSSEPCHDAESQWSNKDERSVAGGEWVSNAQPVANGRLCTTSSRAIASQKYWVLQSGTRGSVTGTHSCDLTRSCLKWLTMVSTSNCSALSPFGRNIVIWLILAGLMNN